MCLAYWRTPKKQDWDNIIKFAKIAREFQSVPLGEPTKTEWIPGSGTTIYIGGSETIQDYPVKSAYAPHLEAFLRLGRFKEANDLYDEMIRNERKIALNKYRSNNARIAANVAKKLGLDDLANNGNKGNW